jgi:hypothetical protein
LCLLHSYRQDSKVFVACKAGNKHLVPPSTTAIPKTHKFHAIFQEFLWIVYRYRVWHVLPCL